MNWTAPSVDHLLEQRLQAARLELMEDRRIQGAVEKKGSESIRFIADLIRGKIDAAARNGFGAAEASLRLDASDFLTGRGYDVEVIRRELRAAAEPMLTPPAAPVAAEKDAFLTPVRAAGLFFLLWLVAAGILWQALNLYWLWLVLIVGAGALPMAGIHSYLSGNAAIMKKALVSELPAVLCRHYMRVLHAAVGDYEVRVNELGRSQAARVQAQSSL
ncbi:MAG: hypothetical protein IT368_01770 [Candidatus Hydrogenedentes bacterium]|nr:hypothetical protein [Candidatus Hydrogenedentota bacterium]